VEKRRAISAAADPLSLYDAIQVGKILLPRPGSRKGHLGTACRRASVSLAACRSSNYLNAPDLPRLLCMVCRRV